MSDGDDFGLFVQDEDVPLWRACFTDLGAAKIRAQELANEEGFEFFVFNFRDRSEVARFFPVKSMRERPQSEIQNGLPRSKGKEQRK